MKTIGIFLACAMILGLVGKAMAGGTGAAPAKAPAVTKETVVGTVHVTKNGSGAVTAIIIQAANGNAYNVQLNATGEKLAAQDGQPVKVMGVLSVQNGKPWLDVKKCDAVRHVVAHKAIKNPDHKK